MPERLPKEAVPAQPQLSVDIANNQEIRDAIAAAAKVCGARFATIAQLREGHQYNYCSYGFELDRIDQADSLLYRLQQGSDLVVCEDVLNLPLLSPILMGNESLRILFYVGVPLYCENGNFLAFLCIYHDAPNKISSIQLELLKTVVKKLSSLVENNTIDLNTGLSLDDPEAEVIRREKLFDGKTVVTLLLDKNFRVVTCHPYLSQLICENLQLEIKAGDDIRDYLGPQTKSNFIENYYKALDGKSISLEIKYGICWGGVQSYCHFSPAYDLSGKLIGVSYHALPILPENTENHISLRDRKRIQWINDLQSHRFRGPVSSILGITQIWKELGSAPQQQEINMIIEAANKLDREIQSALLELSKSS